MAIETWDLNWTGIDYMSASWLLAQGQALNARNSSAENNTKHKVEILSYIPAASGCIWESVLVIRPDGLTPGMEGLE